MIYGIFGGSFNPPHIGHYITTREVLEQTDIDKIIIIPTGVTPLKEDVEMVNAIHRFEMCKQTFGDDKDFIVSNIESSIRNTVSYTINTLKYLQEKYPDANGFRLIIGIDQYLQFDKWKDYEEILRLTKLYVMNRGGINLTPDNKIPASFVRVSNLEISSTNIRERISKGESIKYLVDPRVANYIYKNLFYRRKNHG